MSWQDIRHHYEERDDEPDPEPVRILCSCGAVLADPEDAAGEVVEAGICDACAAREVRDAERESVWIPKADGGEGEPW